MCKQDTEEIDEYAEYLYNLTESLMVVLRRYGYSEEIRDKVEEFVEGL